MESWIERKEEEMEWKHQEKGERIKHEGKKKKENFSKQIIERGGYGAKEEKNVSRYNRIWKKNKRRGKGQTNLRG